MQALNSSRLYKLVPTLVIIGTTKLSDNHVRSEY